MGWESFQLCCDLVGKKKKKKQRKIDWVQARFLEGGGSLKDIQSLHFLGCVLRVIFVFQQFLTALQPEEDAGTFLISSLKRQANLENWEVFFLPAVYSALHLNSRHDYTLYASSFYYLLFVLVLCCCQQQRFWKKHPGITVFKIKHQNFIFFFPANSSIL